jgi:hypothetical protein
MMTRSEAILRLSTISKDALRLLRHLEGRQSDSDQDAEFRRLAADLKSSVQEEYDRIIPARAQKGMTLFELTVYSPTIEEVWKETGISRLKVDGPISKKWQDILEAVAYKTSKYIS